MIGKKAVNVEGASMRCPWNQEEEILSTSHATVQERGYANCSGPTWLASHNCHRCVDCTGGFCMNCHMQDHATRIR